MAEYKKDSATTHMILHQKIYSITHDPSASITVFIDAVYSVTHQLKAIGCEPTNLEISNKLLIRLHQLWSPICTMLTLCEKPKVPELETITSVLKQFEANETSVFAHGKSELFIKTEINEAELALYAAKSQGGGGKGTKGRQHDEDCDWGNTVEWEGVCWRCGREGHVVKNCVADMPEDIKHQVLCYDHAASAVMDSMDDLFTFTTHMINLDEFDVLCPAHCMHHHEGDSSIQSDWHLTNPPDKDFTW